MILTIYITIEAAYKFSIGISEKVGEGPNVIGEIVSSLLGLFLISIWFKRNEIFCDKMKHEILVKHTGLFGARWNAIPLEYTRAIYVSHGRIRATEFGNIGILYKDGRRKWLTRIHDKTQANEISASFSKIIDLPIMDTSKT